MTFAEVAATSQDVTRVSGRFEKVGRLARLLSALGPDEVEPVVAFLSGEPRQGRIGIGHAAIQAAFTSPIEGSTAPPLAILEVDEAFGELATLKGAGSARRKAEKLGALVARTAGVERDFLRRLLYGELRQGALEGVLVDAVAKAANVSPERMRRAAMMVGNLAQAARTAMVSGASALDALGIRLMQPVKPMLADSAEGVADAFAAIADAGYEYKLDGARVQIHRDGDDVRVYSRTLNDVTDSVPEIGRLVRALPVRNAILDGEVLALKTDGTPHAFQDTMRRFGRTRDVAREAADRPLTPFLFDCLYLDDVALIDESQERRVQALRDVAAAIAVPRVVRPTLAEAEAFTAEALARGHEGVMAKALEAPYAAGRRGSAWLKIKQARTLDLVVLAVEWGSGRRQGFLSNIHLGARDPATNGFVMLGKTFKGMTDAMLAWQTEHFKSLEIGRDAFTVYVRPETVVEIAFNDVQRSPIYPGGVALRFARVKRYRPDKKAVDADTIDTVRGLAPAGQ